MFYNCCNELVLHTYLPTNVDKEDTLSVPNCQDVSRSVKAHTTGRDLTTRREFLFSAFCISNQFTIFLQSSKRPEQFHSVNCCHKITGGNDHVKITCIFSILQSTMIKINTYLNYKYNFVEIPRKFIIVKLSIRKLGSSSVNKLKYVKYFMNLQNRRPDFRLFLALLRISFPRSCSSRLSTLNHGRSNSL